MRHRKHTFKIGRTSSHRRCLIANMLKSLIVHGQVETTITKAKELRRHADQMVSLAKKNTLASRRQAIAALMIRYNALTSKEARAFKEGDLTVANDDRQAVRMLFDELGPRFATRNGGYTRIIKLDRRVGDNAPTCVLQYIE